MLISLFKPLLALILAASLFTGPRVQIALFSISTTIPIGAMQEEEEHRGHRKVVRTEHSAKTSDPENPRIYATFERLCPTDIYRCATPADPTSYRQIALLAALSGQLRC
jgi:hypothetical protein